MTGFAAALLVAAANAFPGHVVSVTIDPNYPTGGCVDLRVTHGHDSAMASTQADAIGADSSGVSVQMLEAIQQRLARLDKR